MRSAGACQTSPAFESGPHSHDCKWFRLYILPYIPLNYVGVQPSLTALGAQPPAGVDVKRPLNLVRSMRVLTSSGLLHASIGRCYRSSSPSRSLRSRSASSVSSAGNIVAKPLVAARS